MSTDEIHDRLHVAGYDRVYRIRRQGDVYVARGERDNRVYALEADAMTGRILASDEVGRREPGSGAQTRTAPTTAATGPVQSEQQIRDRLQQAGYDQVSSVRREGDAYRAQAQWANRSYDVRLDAQTGRIMSSTPVRSQSGSGAGQSGQMGTGAAGAGAGGMDEAQVRTALLNEGYSQISNLRREGDVYAARAVRNTQTFNLRVDAQNGRIVQATPVTGQGGG